MAKRVWQTTADAFQTKQREEILRERISQRRWPHHMDTKMNQTMAAMETLLKTPVMNQERRTSLAAACSKLVTQYTSDLLGLHLQVVQDIRRAYQETLSTLLKDLFKTDWTDSVKRGIVDRQDKIVERYDLRLKHKLSRLSDEDPTLKT